MNTTIHVNYHLLPQFLVFEKVEKVFGKIYLSTEDPSFINFS